MRTKKLPAAAPTVERGFFSLEEIRKMKPIVPSKPHKDKEARK